MSWQAWQSSTLVSSEVNSPIQTWLLQRKVALVGSVLGGGTSTFTLRLSEKAEISLHITVLSPKTSKSHVTSHDNMWTFFFINFVDGRLLAMPSVWTVIRLICISYINFTSITALQDAHCAISRSNDYSYVSNLIGCLRCLIITKIIVYIVRLYTNCVNLSQITWLSTNQMWISLFAWLSCAKFEIRIWLVDSSTKGAWIDVAM